MSPRLLLLALGRAGAERLRRRLAFGQGVPSPSHAPPPLPQVSEAKVRRWVAERRKRGFSVIEALVAIAVASIGLIAVFALQRQLIDGQRRYEHALERSEARRNVVALLRDLNPTELPTGRMELPPNARLEWTSRPLTEFTRTTGLPVGDGMFEVRLYSVEAKLTDAADRPREALTFDRLGWRRIGGPATPETIGF